MSVRSPILDYATHNPVPAYIPPDDDTGEPGDEILLTLENGTTVFTYEDGTTVVQFEGV
jgi:hypothetical protein